MRLISMTTCAKRGSSRSDFKSVIAPSLEFLFWQFQTIPGLFILGAGASSPRVEFGQRFITGPALSYVRGGSFPIELPVATELTRKIRSVGRTVPLEAVFPGRPIRPGSSVIPYEEFLDRLPDGYARLSLKHALSKLGFKGEHLENYEVFRFFARSLLLNYNLDGLASEHCRDVHRVVDPHGTVPSGYGSLELASLIGEVREFDIRMGSDGLVLCEMESIRDMRLAASLRTIDRYSPAFVAIIGYSFGRTGNSYDDWISLAAFERKFTEFTGDIYILDPQPRPLCEMLAERLKSNRVIGIRSHWNVLSHAFLLSARGQVGNRSINWVCEDILDRLGGDIFFPLPQDSGKR
jgi:hypothetical protein